MGALPQAGSFFSGAGTGFATAIGLDFFTKSSRAMVMPPAALSSGPFPGATACHLELCLAGELTALPARRSETGQHTAELCLLHLSLAQQNNKRSIFRFICSQIGIGSSTTGLRNSGCFVAYLMFQDCITAVNQRQQIV